MKKNNRKKHQKELKDLRSKKKTVKIEKRKRTTKRIMNKNQERDG